MSAGRPERTRGRRWIRATLSWIVLGFVSPASPVAAGLDPALRALSLRGEDRELQVFVEMEAIPGEAVEIPRVCGPKAVELRLEGAWAVPRSAVAELPELAALRVDREEGGTALRFEFRREVRDARLFTDTARGEVILVVAFRGPGAEAENPAPPGEPTATGAVGENTLLTRVNAAASAAGTAGGEDRSQPAAGEARSADLALLLLALSGAAVGAWGVLARRTSAAVAESGRIDELNRRISEELRRFEEEMRGWEEG